ncbi:ribosomal rna large subunit methyltransferase j protein [Cystoisospora suis]|uniref:Ribosomal rna large subunit methyltransferase j protein n=1 Tax=Cystoisospora suis TaxID=483139 RepID=A0A2C6KJE2_9APIC|nr:ribosomal rna large subunit methyltransferase j protein [Cystoisospora suis]
MEGSFPRHLHQDPASLSSSLEERQSRQGKRERQTSELQQQQPAAHHMTMRRADTSSTSSSSQQSHHRPSHPSQQAHPHSSSSSGLLVHQHLPEIRLERYYCFRSSLQRLQYAGGEIPSSKAGACRNCEKKKVKCICEAVATQVGKTPSFSIEELDNLRHRLDEIRKKLSRLDITEWKKHTSTTDLMKRVLPTIKERVRERQHGIWSGVVDQLMDEVV